MPAKEKSKNLALICRISLSGVVTTHMRPNRVHSTRDIQLAARELRKNLTPAEAQLWEIMSRRQLLGTGWYRQYQMGPFIYDLACPALGLLIEVDGAGHDQPEQQVRDREKEDAAMEHGWTVIRVSNELVLESPGLVRDRLARVIRSRERT